jgi:probable rRNA maturation factor
VQYAVPRRGLPGARSIRSWAHAAWKDAAEVTVRIVGAAEGRRLNRAYRGIDRPTNVLSFAYGRRRGDVVLCHPVVAREARAQGKTLSAHYAHLVVHGMLHLRGMDHDSPALAARMERRETRVLATLGVADPYTLQ